MSLRYFANAPATTLTASCSSGATSIAVASVTGLPIQYPYTLILDRGLSTEEAVSVINASSLTLTVTRAIDSTTAFAHAIGATVEHGITAQDIRESNAHVNATSAVHGVAGALVGTTDSQTLTNKTIAAGSNTINGLGASVLPQTDGTGKLVAGTKVVPTGALVGTTDAQTLTGKTVALGSNTVSGTKAQFDTACTDADFASLAGAETLTNKTLTSPAVNTPAITNPAITVGGLTAKPPLNCTSATRPAHAAGQVIYETDTGRTLQSNGTVWSYVELNDWVFGGNRLDSAVANPTTPPVGLKFATGTQVVTFSGGVGTLTFPGGGFAIGVISIFAMATVGTSQAIVGNAGLITKTTAQVVATGLNGNATISYLVIGW